MTYRLILDANNTVKRSPNPRSNASIIGIITYSWMLNLFKIGRKKDLCANDLYATLNDYNSSSLGDELEKKWRIELENAKNVNRNPGLLKTLIRIFGFKYMLYGLLIFVDEMILKMLQPFFFAELLAYFNPDGSNEPDLEYAYVCAIGLVTCLLLSTILAYTTQSAIIYCGMKMRIACCSLIFRKSLRLSRTSLSETSVGQVINLVSQDIGRFDDTLFPLHYLWIGPLQTVAITYFLWQEIGVSSLLGTLTLFFFVPLQGWLGKKISEFRTKTAVKTDDRIRLMSEIVSGIQVIKMYTWEKPFAKLIKNARDKEIGNIKGSMYIKASFRAFTIIQTRFQLFVSILSYVLLGNVITVRKIFVTTTLYNILLQTMTRYFTQGLEKTPELLVTIKRVQIFLTLDEKNSNSSTSTRVIPVNQEDPGRFVGKTISNKEAANNDDHDENADDFSVNISNATTKWTADQKLNTLENINLSVRPGQLVAIIGPVGAGKSSLVQAVLRELPLSNGKISVDGVVSYASQKPWLFAGSVRQNILFDSEMDLERYKQVVQVCALKNDFERFPFGDETIVGERGVSLSGGQRARINLARAVYKQADIYLLDDPLSAVDTRVGKHIFEKCITGYLEHKTCILITHQIQYLTDLDRIVLMENARILAEGSYEELQSSGLDFVKLTTRSSDERSITSDPESNGHDDYNIIVSGPITDSQGSNESNLSPVDKIKLDGALVLPKEETECQSFGGDTKNVYGSYMLASGSTCNIILLVVMYVFTQIPNSGADYWITYWVNKETYVFNVNNSVPSDNGTSTIHDPLEGKATDFRQTCVLVYTILTVSLIVCLLIRSVLFVTVCTGISINLHERMFNAIIRAKMMFFNKNPSGRILNRFSKDISAVDDVLPPIFLEFSQTFIWILGIVFLIGLINIYLMIPLFIMGVVIYQFKNSYLRTSGSIKRLEAVTKSPVFSHFSTSIEGLVTIRAYEAERILTEEFDKHQDLHSSASYLLIASNQAFGFWLDIVSVIYSGIAIFSFLIVQTNVNGGNVGLAISQAFGLAGRLQSFLRHLALFENEMTSVKRIIEYTNVPQETSLQSHITHEPPPKGWPTSGEISFQNVYLRYGPDEPYVLKNINFKIQHKDKVGIVGRTGAGKSSIIGALFRLALSEGKVIIDGIDVHEMEVHDLRSKMSIIPQEPVLFSGTMRKNLDPFDEYPDHVLWNALDKVEMKIVIDGLPGGLNSKMSENGSNFSVGQRQLVCLARALVRNNKILVLDEATANVDPKTDALIQNTIKNQFQTCTVLTIAHRLNTVMDSDKVLVMDSGTVVEFDHPHNLLKNTEGFFYKMVRETGEKTADFLHNVAAQNFTSKYSDERRRPEQFS